MGDFHHLQTPQKADRRPKFISHHTNKNQKIVKMNLNPALSVFSEVASVESPEELNLIDFTSISETSEHNLIGELSEDLTASLSAEASPGSEGVASSALTPLSSTITIDDHAEKSENVNQSCSETELVVKHLKEAQLQLFNERTMDLQSKRLLDALINVIIKEFYEMPHEEEGYNEAIPKGTYLAFISIMLLILAAPLVIICFSGSHNTFNGPTAT